MKHLHPTAFNLHPPHPKCEGPRLQHTRENVLLAYLDIFQMVSKLLLKVLLPVFNGLQLVWGMPKACMMQHELILTCRCANSLRPSIKSYLVDIRFGTLGYLAMRLMGY